MSATRMQRTLKRMACQVYEHTGRSSGLVLLGIDQRGHSLAGRLKSYLGEITENTIQSCKLSINDSDDSSDEFPDLSDQNVVLVDDVIFTGRTVYHALHKLFGRGEPRSLTLAVLIDRGHRAYPVEAQYVGLHIPSKLNEHVTVMLSELEQADQVLLELSV